MNIRKLSMRQLEALSQKIERRREQLRREQAREVRQRVMEEIRSAGLSVEDVLPGTSAGKRRAQTAKAAPAAPGKARKTRKGGRRRGPSKAVAVRGMSYANPSDPSMTWSGYGRRPQWFLDAIAGGKTEVDLRSGAGGAGSAKAAKPTRGKRGGRKAGKGRKAAGKRSAGRAAKRGAKRAVRKAGRKARGKRAGAKRASAAKQGAAAS